jgi:hypothetical protein
MENNLIPASVQAEVNGQIKQLLSDAKIESIGDKLQRENLGELVKMLARERIYLKDERAKAKAPHLAAGKAVDDYFNPVIAGLEKMEGAYGLMCLSYDNAERKKIEDARLAAEREQAAEKARLEALEVKKREETARLTREAEAKQAAIAAAQGAEKARLEAEKAELERKANMAYEAANKKEEQKNAVQAAPVYDTYVAPSGIKPKVTYRVNVKNAEAFIRACVAQEKFHWLAIEEGLVNKEITANEGKWKFPGAEVVEESGTRVNSRMRE